MAKKQEIYWFKHEGNAHRQQAIMAMRTIYGSEGYGWYWILIEMMREAEDYKLGLIGKYDMVSLAKETETEQERIKEFITDCIKEFKLFDSDGESFWSPMLTDKMIAYDAIVEKRKQAANDRWK